MVTASAQSSVNGRILVNKDTGQAKVTQVIDGVDIQEYLDGIKTVKSLPVKMKQDKIDSNTKVLASLDEFKKKLTTFQQTTSVFANRLSGESIERNPVASAFKQKQINASASNGADASRYVGFVAGEDTNPATFQLTVNQLASSDLRKGTLTATNNITNLGLSGSFQIGTSLDSLKTVTVNASMSLDSICDAINAHSGVTNVNAETVMVSQGSPATYEIKLKGAITGAPIQLKATSGTLLQDLGLTGTGQRKISGMLAATNTSTALNLSGDMTVSVSDGTSFNVPVLTTDTLSGIVNNINSSQGLPAKVTASLQLVNSGTSSTYQIKLECVDSSKTVSVSDTGNVVSGLGLSSPNTDYLDLVAKVNCDGTAFIRTTNSINDIISNVTLSLFTSDPTVNINGSVSVDTGYIGQSITEFISAYNDLNDFYKTQTKMKEDFSGPEEGADLYNNNYVKRMFAGLKASIMSAAGSSSKVTGLRNLGIALDNSDGSLKIENTQKLVQTIESDFLEIQKFFANTVTITGPGFSLNKAPASLSSQVHGKNVAATIAVDGNGLATAAFTLNGQTYQANVRNVGGRYYITGKDSDPIFKDFELSYLGSIAPNTSATTDFSISRGMMSTVDLSLKKTLDPTPVQGQRPPNDIAGELLREIASYTFKNTELLKNIDTLKSSIEKEMQIKEKEFQAVYQAYANLQNLKMFVDSFNKSNRG